MPALLSRRHLLRLGTLALGTLALPRPLRARPPARADACILLYMDGGPSHLDLWDLKPDAPPDVRGPFRPVRTTAPGVTVCEHLPRMATRMHRVVQVRSVRHGEAIHDPAVYQMLTGRRHPASAGNLTVQPTDFPHLGATFARLDGRPAILPKAVELPETMRMGGRVLPGQNAGFLGARHDPLRVEVTPGLEVRPPDLTPPTDLPPDRLAGRASLRDRLEAVRRGLDRQAAGDDFSRQALDLLADPRVGRAFDLSREADRLRDTYGRNRHGQSVLLARRLVEAGARFVTVYWGKEEQDWADGKGRQLANNPWDTHRNHFPLTKDELLPRADRALAALLDDLEQRGLLGRTLVLWMGDFGRTPRVTKFASRDHWPHANTVLLAGAGLPGGRVYGRTDRLAAEVTEDPVSPADLAATVLSALGVEPSAELHDRQGRPYPAAEGEPVPLW